MIASSELSRAHLPDARQVALAIAGGLAVFGISFALLHASPLADAQIVDTPLYERVGDAVLDGEVPYRDFALEYPPGALPAFVLPALAPGGHFRTAFETLMVLCGLGMVALVGIALARAGASRARVLAGCALAGAAPLAAGSVVLTRFDLWPAMLTAAALAALAAERDRLGVALIGLATMAKVYPAVLLPLALVYVGRRRGGREALVCLGLFAAVVGVILLPFAILDAGGLLDSFTRQAGRPLQVESLSASLLYAAHEAGGYDPTIVSSHGSQNLFGSLPDALADVQTVFQAAAVVAVWALFLTRRASAAALFAASAAAVAAFIAFGKVLSPQFVIWLFPLVPLVLGPLGIAAGGLFLLALLVTQLGFPHRYWNLIALDAGPVWLLVARNVLLVALAGVLAAAMRSERAPSRTPWPDRGDRIR